MNCRIAICVVALMLAAGCGSTPEQADLLQAVFGGHGDDPRVVLAPCDVEDCYDIAHHAFSIAESFRRLGGGFPHKVLLNKYYVDEGYEAVFIRPGFKLSKSILWKIVDAGLIDGLMVNGSALVVAVLGSVLRIFQNGMVRFYAWSFTIGVAVFVLYLSFSG